MPPLRLLQSAAGLVLAAGLAWPAGPRAHGVSSEVEQRGDARAVRVRYHGGKPLADAVYQVLRPGSPDTVAREGRTPSDGWIEFVPDVPGAWRVKIVDRTGHGRVVTVDVPARAPAPPPEPAVVRAPPAAQETAPPPEDGARHPLAVAAGAAAIVAGFAALRAVRRRRGAGT